MVNILVALVLLLVSPRISVKSVDLDTMLDAGARAVQTEVEEFYCGVGRVEDGVVVVDSLVRPEQITKHFVILNPFDGTDKEVSAVNPEDCPAGTVLDFHTHPWPGVPEYWPSVNDQSFFPKDPYDIHLISFPVQGGIVIMGWEQLRSGDYSIRQIEGRLEVT